MKRKRTVVCGCMLGLIVLLSGFGMMCVLWNMSDIPDTLRGLFSYKAATIGDAVCLPVLTGALYILTGERKLSSKGEKTCRGMAVIAFLMGMAVQASWLISDKTILNWSIPVLHHFNIAGWYHSIFFCLMFGVITYLFSRVWFAMHEQVLFTKLDNVFLSLAIAAGSTFFFLWLYDDFSAKLSVAYLFSLGAMTVFAVMLFFVCTASNEREDGHIFALAMGVVLAYEISLFLCQEQKEFSLLALCGGMSIGFIWRIKKSSLSHMILFYMITVPCYTMGLVAAQSMHSTGACFCVLGVIVFFTVMIEKSFLGEIRFRSVTLLMICAYILLDYSTMDDSWYGVILNFIFTGIVECMFVKEVRDTFNILIKEETRKNQNNPTNHNLNEMDDFIRIKTAVYFQMGIGIIMIAMMLARWIADIALRRGEELSMGSLWGNMWIWKAMGIVVLLLLFLKLVRLNKCRLGKVIIVIGILSLYGMLSYRVLRCLNMDLAYMWDVRRKIMFFCSICGCIGSAIMVSHGFWANIVLIGDMKKSKWISLLSVIMFSGCMVILTCSLILVLNDLCWMNLINIAISELGVVLFIPGLCVCTMFNKDEKKKCMVIPGSMWQGIWQDGLMIFVLLLFGVLLPCSYVCLMRDMDVEAIAGTIGLISTAFVPVVFCLKNNVGHMQRQKEVLKKYPGEEERWNQLHKRLLAQSWQTVFATIPYSLVMIVMVLLKQIVLNKTFKEMYQHVITTYIDAYRYQKDTENEGGK